MVEIILAVGAIVVFVLLVEVFRSRKDVPPSGSGVSPRWDDDDPTTKE